jgi:hypothetical protein
MNQSPHELSNVTDLIESSEVYDTFSGNSYEVEVLLDYLHAQNITPTRIYKDVRHLIAAALILGSGRCYTVRLLPFLKSRLFQVYGVF